MGLIRNKNAAVLLRDAVVLDLGDIASQADEIRRCARMDAKRITDEARAAADLLSKSRKEEGYESGYQEGFEAGFAQGVEDGNQRACDEMKQAIDSSQQAWHGALDVFIACRENLEQEAKQDVLRLSLELAERIIYRAIAQDPTIIEDQLAETLQLLSERTAVVVHVNPRDLATAEAIMPELIDQLKLGPHVRVVGNGDVSAGGCYVRAGHGDIDARIETQLSRIVETLLPSTGRETIAEDTETAIDNAIDSADASNREPNRVPDSISPTAMPSRSSEPSGGDENTSESESTIVDSFLSDGPDERDDQTGNDPSPDEDQRL